MNRFFRDNIIGVLALSAAGSLIATLIARFISTSTSGGASFVEAVSRPIPVWSLFPYSVLLVLAFALWALRTRHKDQQDKIAEQSVLKDQIATIRGERDAVRQQFDVLAREPARGIGQDERLGRRLQGPAEINAAFESVASMGSKRIQLWIQVLGPEPHLPDSLADTIARRIQETSRLGIPIKYDPVLVLDREKTSPAFLEGISRRADVFSRRGVAQFVRPRYLQHGHNSGMDILIVDKTHLLIALNTVPSATTMQVGFLFRDRPEVASEFSDWFDHVVMPNTQDLIG